MKEKERKERSRPGHFLAARLAGRWRGQSKECRTPPRTATPGPTSAAQSGGLFRAPVASTVNFRSSEPSSQACTTDVLRRCFL